MSTTSIPVSESSAFGAKTVPVWDLGVRLFHWSLVATVAAAALTGFVAPEWWIDIHIAAGTAVAALIAFRLMLGFVGSPYARFRAFAYRPSESSAYFKSLISGHAEHYRGHNPLGAAMVFGLIAVLILLCVTGAFVLGGVEKRGPLAFAIPFSLGDAAEELHEFLSWAVIGMISLHVGGVLFASWHERFNLVASMIHGRKPDRACADEQPAVAVRPVKGVIIAALILSLAGLSLTAMSYLPAAGIPRAKLDPRYRTECGDCHIAYHPSLLPSLSWQRIMTSLDDHFGEDASLSDRQVREISAYLTAHSAENFDTEAANRFRKVNPTSPMRITETRFWRRKHHDIPEAVFRSKAIGAAGACGACHADAETGLFADAAIALPETRPISKAE